MCDQGTERNRTGTYGPGSASLSGCIGLHDRVDSVIESSLREIIGGKNFALIKLSLNSRETTIYDNNVFLENLDAVH